VETGARKPLGQNRVASLAQKRAALPIKIRRPSAQYRKIEKDDVMTLVAVLAEPAFISGMIDVEQDGLRTRWQTRACAEQAHRLAYLRAASEHLGRAGRLLLCYSQSLFIERDATAGSNRSVLPPTRSMGRRRHDDRHRAAGARVRSIATACILLLAGPRSGRIIPLPWNAMAWIGVPLPPFKKEDLYTVDSVFGAQQKKWPCQRTAQLGSARSTAVGNEFPVSGKQTRRRQ